LKPDGTTDTGVALKLALRHPTVQFNDYTKSILRAERFAAGKLPPNVYITFSRSETTPDSEVRRLVKAGVNVAVVFLTVPETYLGLPVIDGDKHDWRFLDPKHVIVGLKAKGKALTDRSGFVVRED
jgi:hypothetical protein